MRSLFVRRWACRHWAGETGAVALLVGILTVIMFTIAAMVVDLGQARVMRRSAQAASDASALAAATALYLDGTKTPNLSDTTSGHLGAVQVAESYAEDNYGVSPADWATCTDSGALAYTVPGQTQCISFDDELAPTMVRVVVPTRQVDTPFANVVGVDHVDVGALAEVQLTPGGLSDCGLCVVGAGPHDLQNGDTHVTGGNIALNGDVSVSANGLVSTGGQIFVGGDASGDGYMPAPVEHASPVDDPLAEVPMPTYSGLTVKTDPCGNGADHGPGIYGDVSLSGGDCTLQPGTYVITGQWSLAGGAALDGSDVDGVTLYFTCGTPSAPVLCVAPGQEGGSLNAAGNAAITINAPDTDPNQGWGIVYDRMNKSDLVLSGNGSSIYKGTVYAVSASLHFNGNGCSTASTALVVVSELSFDGNGACLSSTYEESDNVWVPPQDPHLTK